MPLASNIYVNIFEDIIQDLAHSRRKKQGPKGPLLFDNQNLKFIPNRSFNKMNVVVVVLESTRAHSVTPYFPKVKTTPFLDQLAKKSLMVDWMYPVIPHTSKALVSILCGVPPKITMSIDESRIKGLPGNCLPNLLKPLGYQTAFFQTATWHFERRSQLTENMGYQFFRSHEGIKKDGYTKTHYFGYPDKMLIKPSMDWVKKQQKANKPFFLTYLTLTSHHGYEVPEKFKKVDFIKNPKGKREVEFNKYLNSLRYTDDFVRELLEQFRKKGLIKNTLFVFVGDHGEAFYEHKRWQHDNGLWEEILRIPSFIYNPKLFPKAQRIKGLRQQMDIVPTIADILGVDLREGHLPGISMLKKVPKDRELYYSCWYKKYCLAVRHKNMKYVYNYGRMEPEVYDLSKDPLEKDNLFDKEKYKEHFEKHKKNLLIWRDHINGIYESPYSHL